MLHIITWLLVSTHSRPKAAGAVYFVCRCLTVVSTHSRPKAAGWQYRYPCATIRSFNTQPPEGGWRIEMELYIPPIGFNTQPPEGGWQSLASLHQLPLGFNTQPPEGGWCKYHMAMGGYQRFQHTAARRRLELICGIYR